ncbi:MAG: hypothetical protein HEP71_05375 [Roseivirga sp.]|nr:hypothetical protein [Roseivirga sp.]
MVDYLLEASVCLVCLYLFYWLVLSRQKLLSLNRLYLLISVTISLAFPLITITLSMEIPETVQVWRSSQNLPESVPASTEAPGTGVSLLSVIYWIGLSLTLIMFLMKIKSIRSCIRSGQQEKAEGLTFVYINSRQAFSFFHYVFINKEVKESTSGTSVIEHEKAHIKGLHSLDLLLLELVKTLFWFNPIIYLYHKALKLQHEYIADEAVIRSWDKASYADLLVRYSLKQSGYQFAHSFSAHPVEKRLKMIDNPKATKMKKLRSILIPIPLFAILFITVSCADTSISEPSDEITLAELKISIDELKEMLEKQNKEVVSSHFGFSSVSDVTGWLKDSKTNEPIINAKIWSLPSGKSTSPNEEGFYRLPSTPKDTLVTYKAIGYKSLDIARNDYRRTNNVKLESRR